MGNGDGKVRLRTRDRPTPARGLSASLAHEINNPLESLLNLLFLLEGEPVLTESGRHYLALAQEEVRRDEQGNVATVIRAGKSRELDAEGVLAGLFVSLTDRVGSTRTFKIIIKSELASS